MKKLGVIVPYRNRPDHLKEFKRRIVRYLDRTEIPYEIIIVNQDESKLFNRGILLNIGFVYAKKLNCDYVVFHDVDMIPVQVDYSYSDVPLHLANNIDKETFDTYFGGVTMFPIDAFEKINGYPNKYWGWGYEDDDLLLRCKKFGIKLDEIKIKNIKGSGKIVKFNGVNSYVKGKNIFNFNQNISIFISFYTEKLTCDHTKENDEFSIFSIPGYDFSISYNSFSRYNFCTFDAEKNVLYVNSKIKTNYKTNICLTINNTDKIINVYQDGKNIGLIKNFDKLYSYAKEPFFYIGVGDPNRLENPKYFKGYFDSLIIFSEVLSSEEVFNLSQNYSYCKYLLPESIKLYYDAKIISGYKLIDLSGNGNDGELVNCKLSKEEIDEFTKIQVPFRQESKFQLLKHEENGFLGYKWKDQATRWNQLRFYNEVSKNEYLISDEGLNNLEYSLYNVDTFEKITQVNVGL
jgi:hypothetical protein